MRRVGTVLFTGMLIAMGISAQGMMGDLLAGKLIYPEVGQWAWYDVTDAASGKSYVLRQAVVGKEEIKRKSLGMENVETRSGLIRAERYEVAQEGKKLTVWINEQVKPTGIVKIESAEGTMVLRDCGLGGEHARSRLDDTAVKTQPERRRPKVTVKAE